MKEFSLILVLGLYSCTSYGSYVNSKNTRCRSECRRDEQCGLGFICDRVLRDGCGTVLECVAVPVGVFPDGVDPKLPHVGVKGGMPVIKDPLPPVLVPKDIGPVRGDNYVPDVINGKPFLNNGGFIGVEKIPNDVSSHGIPSDTFLPVDQLPLGDFTDEARSFALGLCIDNCLARTTCLQGEDCELSCKRYCLAEQSQIDISPVVPPVSGHLGKDKQFISGNAVSPITNVQPGIGLQGPLAKPIPGKKDMLPPFDNFNGNPLIGEFLIDPVLPINGQKLVMDSIDPIHTSVGGHVGIKDTFYPSNVHKTSMVDKTVGGPILAVDQVTGEKIVDPLFGQKVAVNPLSGEKVIDHSLGLGGQKVVVSPITGEKIVRTAVDVSGKTVIPDPFTGEKVVFHNTGANGQFVIDQLTGERIHDHSFGLAGVHMGNKQVVDPTTGLNFGRGIEDSFIRLSGQKIITDPITGDKIQVDLYSGKKRIAPALGLSGQKVVVDPIIGGSSIKTPGDLNVIFNPVTGEKIVDQIGNVGPKIVVDHQTGTKVVVDPLMPKHGHDVLVGKDYPIIDKQGLKDSHFPIGGQRIGEVGLDGMAAINLGKPTLKGHLDEGLERIGHHGMFPIDNLGPVKPVINKPILPLGNVGGINGKSAVGLDGNVDSAVLVDSNGNTHLVDNSVPKISLGRNSPISHLIPSNYPNCYKECNRDFHCGAVGKCVAVGCQRRCVPLDGGLQSKKGMY